MHDDDVGSPVPGSFVERRRRPLRRGAAASGIKMAERFEPLVDVKRAYLPTHVPEHNALDSARSRRGAADDAPAHRRADLAHGLDAFLARAGGDSRYVERVVRGPVARSPDGEVLDAATTTTEPAARTATTRYCVRVIKRGGPPRRR